MMIDTRASDGPGHPGPDGDDAALAAAVARGSREALAILFRRHAEEVHRLAYRITGSPEEAEDVLQDVFVGLARALESYREEGRFLPWLRKVASRVALMRLRAGGRRRWVALDAAAMVRAAPSTPIVDRLALREALAQMPEALRRVFLLKEVEGYPHAEVAELLGISVSASRVRLHRAWAFLHARTGDG